MMKQEIQRLQGQLDGVVEQLANMTPNTAKAVINAAIPNDFAFRNFLKNRVAALNHNRWKKVEVEG